MIYRSIIPLLLLVLHSYESVAQVIVPTYPVDGAETTTSVTFVWEQVDNADAYRLVLSTEQSFASVLIDSTLSVINPRNGIETNDTREFATHGARSDTFFDNLAAINDEDWFSFDVEATNTMTEIRFSPPNPGSIEQFGVNVLSPSGQILSGRTISDIFTYSVPTFPIGKYYVHVEAGIEGNAIFYGDGVYEVLVREEGTATFGAVIQGIENNDSSNFATRGFRSETFIDNLSTVDDQDWFSFELEELNTMTRFEFHPPNPGSIETFSVRIISPTGQVISGRNLSDIFTYSAPTFVLGQYFIQVKTSGEGNPIFYGNGTYSIRARRDPSTSEVYVENLLRNQTYYWHVARIGADDSEEWSPTYSFIAAPNAAPTASFSPSATSGQAPVEITFDASTSSDPNNDSLTYSWGFGDGGIGVGVTATHTYTSSGSYTVTLVVSDGLLTDSATKTISVASGVDVESTEIPTDFSLDAAYPNPFNPVTTIRYSVPTTSHVRIVVTDLLGKTVAVLTDGSSVSPGVYTVRFEAGDLSSGIYLVRMEAGDFSVTRMMVLLR